MGEGFALVGRQHHLEVSNQDFYIDLLLYQLRLRCYIVIELKVGPFKPEYVGKLGFYFAAVDALVKSDQNNPTIGLILCKSADETVLQPRATPSSGGWREGCPECFRELVDLFAGERAEHGDIAGGVAIQDVGDAGDLPLERVELARAITTVDEQQFPTVDDPDGR
jgi:hypothetical protein